MVGNAHGAPTWERGAMVSIAVRPPMLDSRFGSVPRSLGLRRALLSRPMRHPWYF